MDSYSNPEDAAKNLMISTYKDEANKSYTTSGSKDLSVSSVSDISKIPVEGKSIITLVGNYQ